MNSSGYQNIFGDTDDSEDAHHEGVKIHVPPTTRVTRWSHVDDLDLFFTRLYSYHQKRGFYCILLGGVIELAKVLFMVAFCLFLLYFVDYNILFHNKLPKSFNNSTNPLQKVTINDAICSLSECFSHISGATWICCTIVLVFWLFRLIKLLYNLYHFWDIKAFYNIALQISDGDLLNITWHEVITKICEVQTEYQMCIRKNVLTVIDIYHRILRSKNYVVAMVNKSILPIHHNIPVVGNISYMSQGLKYNIELLLFSGTWGMFENWHLKEDYKKIAKRQELAARLRTNITWFAVVNLFLGVFIFVWQLVYFFFNYAELLKREPGVLALRCWSAYGRLYLRHFNELDHELEARLKRAHRPASKYMNTFSSPSMVLISQFIVFIAGSILIVLVALTVIDEDVLTVEHVLTIMTALTALVAIFRGFIPDENMWWNPENLMIEILAEAHYLPDSWRGQAHTSLVRDQFAQFFQYKAVYLLYELISPVVTPIIFFFKLRPRSLDIIDFYRNFTVSVLGVGDVCSFSLLDMRKHGNPTWQTSGKLKCPENNKQTQAEDGKTELSLVHFATMNPTWHPPKEAEEFLTEVKEQSRHIDDQDVDRHSEALGSVSAELGMVSAQNPSVLNRTSRLNHSIAYCPEKGAFEASSYFFNPTFGNTDSMYRSETEKPARPLVAEHPDVDLSISTLYLHSVHHKKITAHAETEHGTRTFSINSGSSLPSTSTSDSIRNLETLSEGTPLLKNVSKST